MNRAKVLLSVLIALVALSTAAKDKPAESIEQLKARAAAADKHKQAELYADLAERELDAANAAYNNNPDQAKALFGDSAKSAELSTQAALDSNHHLKQTEIRLRELSHRMSDIRRSWAFEDRGPLESDIQRVEAAESKLLDRMFEK